MALSFICKRQDESIRTSRCKVPMKSLHWYEPITSNLGRGSPTLSRVVSWRVWTECIAFGIIHCITGLGTTYLKPQVSHSFVSQVLNLTTLPHFESPVSSFAASAIVDGSWFAAVQQLALS